MRFRNQKAIPWSIASANSCMEESMRKSKQRNKTNLISFIIPIALFLLAYPVASSASAPSVASETVLEVAEKALPLLETGDVLHARQILYQALNTAPQNSLLHDLLGVSYLIEGDLVNASAEWNTALKGNPRDGVAEYGLGIAAIADSHPQSARRWLSKAQQDGDSAACLLSLGYLKWVEGDTRELLPPLPDSYRASTHYVNGMLEYNSGDYNSAFKDLNEAFNNLQGNPLFEPVGVIMTFDRKTPILLSSGPHLPPLPLPSIVQPRSQVVSGVVTVSPDYADSDAGYVVFRVDGSVRYLTNSPPYTFHWDTAKVPNGTHQLDITIFDNEGNVLSHATKTITTRNISHPAVLALNPSERLGAVNARLWKLLEMQPDRFTLAYSAGICAKVNSDLDAERKYLDVAASISPDYQGLRSLYLILIKHDAEDSFWRGEKGQKTVALTFDDGPKPGITEQLLAILEQERVPGTFFVIGRHVMAYPKLTDEIRKAGMEIECHTYTHPNLTRLPDIQVERELMETVAAVKLTTGENIRYFRPPGGDIDSNVRRIAADWGLTPCMWTVDGWDMEKTTATDLANWVISRVVPGTILLLHNGLQTTVDALPDIIRALKEKGYTFVTVKRLNYLLDDSKQLTEQSVGNSSGDRE